MATLYQAGENIYSHFDKVLLIDSGHEVFFGRIDEAKSYFEDLGFLHIPGQTTAEFLATATDPAERKTRAGSIAQSIRIPAELADSFKKSSIYAALQIEIGDVEKQQASTGTISSSRSYNLPYPVQIWETLRRESQIFRAQMLVYKTKWINTVILCLVIESMYYGITNDGQGASTRGGILFFALIVNGWLQFPELFDAHTNRPVLERQG